MIDIEALREINYIIEHDSTSSTYKYALLKAVIESTQKYDHLIQIKKGKAHIPLGLIVEQWIIDYMPFVFSSISQQNNKAVLDKPIELHYQNIFNILNLDNKQNWEYAYKQFIKAYKYDIMNSELSNEFFKLSKKIAEKISNMPMKFTGKEHYGFFQPEYTKFGHVQINSKQTYDSGYFINIFGTFSMAESYYQIFRYLGQTLYGKSTIITKWKEKTIALNQGRKVIDELDRLLTNPFDDRDTAGSRSIFQGEQKCVWTGDIVSQKQMDIDHLLPYSIWVNNDFWNLLPTNRVLNQKQKKDKIPTRLLIQKQADTIIDYWKVYEDKISQLFLSQISISLTGSDLYSVNYDKAIEALCKKSDYLIHDRGHSGFEI